MVRIRQNNKRKRRNSLLSQNKFLLEVCVAAGISLCDLTNVHATNDGMPPPGKSFTKDSFNFPVSNLNDRHINLPDTNVRKTYIVEEPERRLEIDGGFRGLDGNAQNLHHRTDKPKRATGSQPTRSQPLNTLENTRQNSIIDRSKSSTDSRFLDLVGRKAPLSYPRPKPPIQKNHAESIKNINRPISQRHNNMEYDSHRARKIQDIQQPNAKNAPRPSFTQHNEQSPRSFIGNQSDSHRTSTIQLNDINRNAYYPENTARSYYQPTSQYQQTQSWTSASIVNENNLSQGKTKPWQYNEVSRNHQIPLPPPRSYPISAIRSNVNDINDSLKGDHRYASPSESILNQHETDALIPRSHGYLTSHGTIFPPTVHDALITERLDQVQSIVEASARLSFGSIQKISTCLMAISLLAYSAVSPRNLPLIEYNLQFYENVRLVCLSTIAPAMYMLLIFDARENDINSVTNTFTTTFLFGYVGVFVLQILATTILRLLLFVWLEPNVFSLCPKVPIPVLPWVLREWQYRPKKITLFAADFGTSCILCPIIEECTKLFLLQRLSNLPTNFKWETKSIPTKKSKKKVAVPISQSDGEFDCISCNQHVTQMVAISVALKLADAARRILLYTKPNNSSKGFYAIWRGIFPIQELCGAMTAIALAKRDLLGVDIPMWKILAPAVVVHGMANFRGKKPIFKWNSSSPWSEMQLSPLNLPDSSTFFQLMKKGYAKLMWIITISRVFGYCVKNYYMVNRHAVKRTTKYAGNPAAFSAELEATELLKISRSKGGR